MREKMNVFEGVLEFQGTWRGYQKRVLDASGEYLADGKIHIVAPPGSGKTTLGIELIRRCGRPCLILSPSITIRQQWLARMEEGFLMPGLRAEDWFSGDLRRARPVTAITYQALYSCMKQYKGRLTEEEGTEEEAEEVDYSGFDLYQMVREQGIQTICLDEAHHLRSEWWKALENFLKNMPEMTVIALTATPPYDSTPQQWKRYTDLCGPIDAEIFTPELVREKCLCPHQDYIYFNRPSREEKKEAEEFLRQTAETAAQICSDERFRKAVAGHRGILSPQGYEETFLENPKYFSALLIFLNEAGIPFSPYLKELTGTKGRLPRLSPEWLEALLQGFLYEDCEAFPAEEEFREELRSRLKAAGCIHRNKVCLTKNEEVQNVLIKSRGKLDSISEIVQAESESLGEGLRLLILCDFIKKEFLASVGVLEREPQEIGAVPVFEKIRRQGTGSLRLGVLSGSVIILPMDTETEIKELLENKGCQGNLAALKDTGYGRLTVRGKEHSVVESVTELFSRGRVNVLVGTKSLLGEGWDAPCVNSLILATYVGSFMLSNQMRGRAIRTWSDDPEKTSNIWHLACVLPVKTERGKEFCGDYETLVRRFETFLGVSYTGEVIENGMERLKLSSELDSGRDIQKENSRMLKMAKDRKGLRRAWENCLNEIHETPQVEAVTEVDSSLSEIGYVFINAVSMGILSAVCMVLTILFRSMAQLETAESVLAGAVAILALTGVCRYGYRALSFCTPQKRMKKVSEAMLKALMETGKMEDPFYCSAEVETVKGLEAVQGIYLKGGSMRDKTLYAACMEEFWGVIDNPRYVLKGHRRIPAGEYYAVPEALGKRKEDALIFEKCMKKALGPCQAVYTRTAEGRRLLLKARTHSFVNKNQKLIAGKKVVKGSYE